MPLSVSLFRTRCDRKSALRRLAWQPHTHCCLRPLLLLADPLGSAFAPPRQQPTCLSRSMTMPTQDTGLVECKSTASSTSATAATAHSRVAKLNALRARYLAIGPSESPTIDEAAQQLHANSLINLNASATLLSMDALHALTRALSHNTSLRILNLWGCGVGEPGAALIGHWLGHTPYLEGLDLRQNELGAVGMRHIAHGLSTNSSLLHLSLGSNRATALGSSAVADALVSAGPLSRLAVLELDSNDIGVAAGLHAARILNSSQGLVHLNLAFNDLGDRGIAELVPGITASPSLASLSLRCCGISALGASIFAEVIASVPLHSVDLGQNDLGQDGAELILAAVRLSPTLDILNVDNYVSTHIKSSLPTNATGLALASRYFSESFAPESRFQDNPQLASQHRDAFTDILLLSHPGPVL